MSHRRPWTQQEIKSATAMAAAGCSAAQIAAEHGRTVFGVRNKLKSLGVRLKQLNRIQENAWTPEDDARAVELLNAGWTLISIGRELGRTEVAVSRRLNRIGVKVEKGRILVNKAAPANAPVLSREMSSAELDALIAEQRRNLPPWWSAECAAVARENAELDALTGHTIPQLTVSQRRNGRVWSAKVI